MTRRASAGRGKSQCSPADMPWHERRTQERVQPGDRGTSLLRNGELRVPRIGATHLSLLLLLGPWGLCS